MSGKIDGLNSTTFPLGIGNAFAGSFVSTVDYNEIVISVETDTSYQLIVNFSTNGTDIGHQEVIDEVFPQVSALDGKSYSFKPFMLYYNVILVNTSPTNAQTYLTVSSILKSNGSNVELNNLRNFQIFSSAGTTGSGSYLINGGNYPKQYTFYGTLSGATNLIVQISPNNATYYDTQYTYTSSGGGNFGFTVPIAASYLRLTSSNSVNCDCWVNSN